MNLSIIKSSQSRREQFDMLKANKVNVHACPSQGSLNHHHHPDFIVYPSKLQAQSPH
jgi:hypothetical protein